MLSREKSRFGQNVRIIKYEDGYLYYETRKKIVRFDGKKFVSRHKCCSAYDKYYYYKSYAICYAGRKIHFYNFNTRKDELVYTIHDNNKIINASFRAACINGNSISYWIINNEKVMCFEFSFDKNSIQSHAEIIYRNRPIGGWITFTLHRKVVSYNKPEYFILAQENKGSAVNKLTIHKYDKLKNLFTRLEVKFIIDYTYDNKFIYIASANGDLISVNKDLVVKQLYKFQNVHWIRILYNKYLVVYHQRIYYASYNIDNFVSVYKITNLKLIEKHKTPYLNIHGQYLTRETTTIYEIYKLQFQYMKKIKTLIQNNDYKHISRLL